MKAGFYLRTAWGNVKKNYRFFVPRILAGAGLCAVFYILLTLTVDERLSEVKGGSYIPSLMGLCTIVMAILSAIILLYANGFLMKQRKREFGLYNILGLEKRHVGRILFFESAFCFIFSTVIGLVTGFLFYKFCTLLICKLLKTEVIQGFLYINAKSVLPTAAFFFLLDLITYIINLIQIARMKPVELLASSRTGEKEPKVNWLVFVIGLVALISGYAIAITVKNAVSALLLFFVAVILVIIGTYCLFSAGSIFILKRLKNRENYYYRKKHMPSVSGLLYRMKHNAVGMASITILSCGILVMLSTTICLYTGINKTLKDLYPYDLYIGFDIYDEEYKRQDIPAEDYQSTVCKVLEDCGLPCSEVSAEHILTVMLFCSDGRLGTDPTGFDEAVKVRALTQEEYERFYGRKLSLAAGEAALFTPSIKEKNLPEAVSFAERSFTVAGTVSDFPAGGDWLAGEPTFGLILPDKAAYDDFYASFARYSTGCSNRLAIRFENPAQAAEYEGFNEIIYEALETYMKDNEIACDGYGYHFDSVWDGREEMYGESGTLLFIGILLGTVFLFATVLIIYYKQISEGYEDKDRFRIMEKIGMSSEEVKATISQQLLMVFFLPLAATTVHIIFAFPMLEKLLHLLLLSNTWVFVLYTLVVYIIFVLVYYLIYRQTAKSYYKIVRWE